MSNTNTGGPAFPSSEYDPQYDRTFHTGGMTLRDYFAAKAMAAEMVSGIHEDGFAWTAARAYKMADAMLQARNV
jgi:hypothetical protein